MRGIPRTCVSPLKRQDTVLDVVLLHAVREIVKCQFSVMKIGARQASNRGGWD